MIRTIAEKTVVILSWAMALLLALIVSILVGYLLLKGLPALKTSLIFGQADPLQALFGKVRVFDGLFPAIVGTVLLVISSTLLAVPIGLGAGIYLAEYARTATKKVFNLFFDILAGVPSIVVGLFGFSLSILLHKLLAGRIGPCLAVSAVSLAFLVLPYVIRSTQTALEDLPLTVRNTLPALGATRLQNIGYVLLPRALSSITSGIILSIGRCAEDTAVIMLTGVVSTAGIPASILDQYEALPFFIYFISSRYTDQADLGRGYGACLILLGTCAVLFLLAAYGRHRLSHRTFCRI